MVRDRKHLYHGKVIDVYAYQASQSYYVYPGIQITYINKKGKECNKSFSSTWGNDLKFFDTEENAMLFCELNNIGG